MTENEAKFLEKLDELANDLEVDMYSVANLNFFFEESANAIRKLIEENQQYRAIGTVEEIQKKMEELERWHTDRINENIKNPFAYTSTSICHNCDHKDEYIEELESEVAEYKSIGTVEEFKALKEKSVAKKVIDNTPTESKEEFWYQCPNCRCDLTKIRGVHCWGCGQKLDWQ